MILPTKHMPANQALIGIGALLLKHIDNPRTVSGLWEQVRGFSEIGNFERFILALDMLYIIGTIDLSNGIIERVTQ